MKKKILVLYQDWNNSFLNNYSIFEHWFKEKDEAFDKKNHYYVFSLSKEKKILEPEKNIIVELFKSNPQLQLFHFFHLKKRLKEIINEYKPDYVYSPFIYLLSLVPKGNYKIVGFLRDVTADMIKAKGGLRKIIGNIFFLLDYIAFKKIDILFNNSPYLELYAKRLGFNKKIIFSPRDVVDKKFYELSKPIKKINNINLSNKKVILSIARLTKEKNLESGIKAMKFLPKNYIYIIIGSGEEKNNLELLIKKLGLQERIFLIGFLEHKQIWSYLKRADLLWLLSKSSFEGIPNAIMESWYSKTPVIVSNIKSFIFFIKNNINGLIITPKPKLIAEKTITLLNNKKLYDKLKKEGFKEVNKLINKHYPVRNIFK